MRNVSGAASNKVEFYFTLKVMSGIGLFDMNRLELLKGPQGDLCGRNSTGGAVAIESMGNPPGKPLG